MVSDCRDYDVARLRRARRRCHVVEGRRSPSRLLSAMARYRRHCLVAPRASRSPTSTGKFVYSRPAAVGAVRLKSAHDAIDIRLSRVVMMQAGPDFERWRWGAAACWLSPAGEVGYCQPARRRATPARPLARACARRRLVTGQAPTALPTAHLRLRRRARRRLASHEPLRSAARYQLRPHQSSSAFRR